MPGPEQAPEQRPVLPAIASAVRGLSVDRVVAGYGGMEVLREVSLEAPPGRITGLIGPNGSGKTTLVRVASRGLAPRSGAVRVEGVDPYSVKARQAARLVAVVPQEVSSAFSFSVLELVLMGRSPYTSPWGGGRAEDWAAARRAMAAANVQHLADRPVEELSGGERQRVVLAQALAQDAPVLLLDEPTTHLDVRHVIDLLATVQRLVREEGRAALAIFHDLNLAAACCDSIVALQDGRVVASGTPAEVVTERLLREVFGIEAEVLLTGPGGRPSVMLTPPIAVRPPVEGAPRAHVVGGAGRGAGLMRGLAELGFEVTTGVLHLGDTDAAVAERLNLLRVSVPPFSVIDPRSAADCADMMAAADVIVVCDAPFGPGNVENLRLVAAVQRRRRARIVLLEQIPVEERDFTGGEATELWHALRRGGGSVAGTPHEILRLVSAGAGRTS